ncbi:MAG: inositol-3-phosphate synthase [Pseudomonadota bacterium]
MKKKAGVMFVGARGHLSTTIMLGALAMRKGLCPPTGMVTALDAFSNLNLTPPENLVFGGWDIRSSVAPGIIHQILAEVGFIARYDLDFIEKEMDKIAAGIFPGTTLNSGEAILKLADGKNPSKPETIKEIVGRLQRDIELFREKHDLEDMVVVNLSSTEPLLENQQDVITLARLEQIIRENDAGAIRAGTLYAYAAINAGCVYINFTPSASALVPGLIELSEKRNLPIMGNDGKTGETLVKSVLAPLFAYRNLSVLSWQGYNMLGNMDGQVLSNASNKSCKVKSKDQVLSKILGYKPHSQVAIDYVPSLGDRKTAWDFIHFEGFLNTKMSLQFTWQGCDSALAAPLVLDLVRLGLFAKRKSESGLMKHLASFFKSPEGVSEYNMHDQFRMLMNYAYSHSPDCGRPEPIPTRKAT